MSGPIKPPVKSWAVFFDEVVAPSNDSVSLPLVDSLFENVPYRDLRNALSSVSALKAASNWTRAGTVKLTKPVKAISDCIMVYVAALVVCKGLFQNWKTLNEWPHDDGGKASQNQQLVKSIVDHLVKQMKAGVRLVPVHYDVAQHSLSAVGEANIILVQAGVLRMGRNHTAEEMNPFVQRSMSAVVKIILGHVVWLVSPDRTPVSFASVMCATVAAMRICQLFDIRCSTSFKVKAKATASTATAPAAATVTNTATVFDTASAHVSTSTATAHSATASDSSPML